MMNFDELRKHALEEVISEKAKEIYAHYYGYNPKFAKEKINEEMTKLKAFYEDQIEES